MKGRRDTETFLTVEDLIDCGQFQRAEDHLRAQRHAGLLGLIHRAEIHTYFDRLEEAGELLRQIQPESLTIAEAARYTLALGEWHYWRFEYEPAEKQFQRALHVYGIIDNEFGQAKALYYLGRIKRRQAEFEAAQQFFNQAFELVKDHKGQKKDLLQALINFNLGVCAVHLGQLDTAADFYSLAMVPLNKLEHGKHYGLTLNSYSTLLMRKGKYEESLSVLKEAISIFQRSPVSADLGAAMNNMALTLIRMGRFDEAGNLLQESLELCQRAGDIAGLSVALETLAQLCLESQDLRQAEKYATEAIEQADLSHNDFVKAEALIALGRVELKRSDFYAAAKPLKEALTLGEKLGNKMLQAEIMLYLAECEFPIRPVVAQERLTLAREILEDHPHVWFSQEIERISSRAKGERIRITPDNWLLINGNLLPNWYAAKEAVETFLVKNALRQSEGNMSKAGEIIGISKVHVRDKKMEYNL
jgi:tetratricopeptide (TPR) repeat protein